MTHRECIDIVARLVKSKFSCGVVLKEIKTLSSEIADIIGFGGSYRSVLVEVKVSRSDFLADKKKPFRINPEKGIGRYRFYACPKGLISPSDLPNNWGLIWVDNNKATVIINPYCASLHGNIWNDGFEFINLQSERDILYSALRRKLTPQQSE